MDILTLTPAPPHWEIPWAALEQTPLAAFFRDMARTPQNPAYHAEGDVWTHTQMVCQALCAMPAFRALPERRRQILFLAALLHDIGKIPCTRLEDGQWTSPHHTATGAAMAREVLWTAFGLCGTPEKQAVREAICLLIRYHSLPAYAMLRKDSSRALRRAASNGALTPDFTLELLCLLAEADNRGRICADLSEQLERVLLCAELAKEAGCYDAPYDFPTAHTGFSYLSGKKILPDQPFYDDTWGEVILLSGLPGTGKDTWIAAHGGGLPVISLDEIRAQLRIAPTAPQSAVIDEAHRRAKTLLRQKQPFIWNATNITPMLRQKQIDLFTGYHAAARVVYLETSWEEQLRRNAARREAVPEAVIRQLLEKLTPPERFEAHRVQWLCV